MSLFNPSPGRAPGLPAENPAAAPWDETYNATDTLLIGIEGLIHAAYMIAYEHPSFAGPERETAALRAVLDTLRNRNESLREMRSAEYRAGRGLVRSEADVHSSFLDGWRVPSYPSLVD